MDKGATLVAASFVLVLTYYGDDVVPLVRATMHAKTPHMNIH